MHLRAAAFVTCVLMLGAGSLRAIEKEPLPAFSVVSPSGAAVASSQLSQEARWLLVYVAADCRSCDRLVSALNEWQRTLPANRLVLVIGAAPDVAQKYAREHGIDDAAGMAWYADVDRSGSRALAVERVPALVAIENGRIEWVVSGVLNDPGAVEPIVRNWTAR